MITAYTDMDGRFYFYFVTAKSKEHTILKSVLPTKPKMHIAYLAQVIVHRS
jgi:hypothetical protein